MVDWPDELDCVVFQGVYQYSVLICHLQLHTVICGTGEKGDQILCILLCVALWDSIKKKHIGTMATCKLNNFLILYTTY